MRRDTSEDRLSEAQTARALARREYQAAMIAIHPPLTQRQKNAWKQADEALSIAVDRAENALLDRISVIIAHEQEARLKLEERVARLEAPP